MRTALEDMDREARDRYLLVIQAKDMMGQMGGLSGTTSVTVLLTDVNDNPPRFPRSQSRLWSLQLSWQVTPTCKLNGFASSLESYQFSIPESEAVTAIVARIRAVDLDVGPNAEMEYQILDGDGLGTFSITTDTKTQEGLVTLNQVRDCGVFVSQLWCVDDKDLIEVLLFKKKNLPEDDIGTNVNNSNGKNQTTQIL